jgi:hypothetical protein
MLVLSSFAYAVGLMAQSVGARRARRGDRVDVSLLAALARDPVYACGFGAQVAGFLFAFLARGTLPLYLVQAATCASVGLAAVMGAVVMGWRVTRAETVVLAMMSLALVLLAGASEPASVSHVAPVVTWLLVVGLVSCALLAVPAWGMRGGVPLACLAGVAFAVLAVASRPLPSAPLSSLALNPLTWLTVLSAVVGQVLLAAALQRGSTTSTGASMDSVTMVLASVAGIALLADPITPGRTWWVIAGLVVIVGGVLAMTRVGSLIDERVPCMKGVGGAPVLGAAVSGQ